MRNEEPPRNSPRGSVLRARHGPYKCACVALSRGGRGCRKRYKRVCLLYISHEGHHCEAGAKRARSRTGAPPPSARACGRLLYSGSPAFRAGRRTCKNAGERGRGARALLSDPFSPRSDSSSESVQIWTWLGGTSTWFGTISSSRRTTFGKGGRRKGRAYFLGLHSNTVTTPKEKHSRFGKHYY